MLHDVHQNTLKMTEKNWHPPLKMGRKSLRFDPFSDFKLVFLSHFYTNLKKIGASHAVSVTTWLFLGFDGF